MDAFVVDSALDLVLPAAATVRTAHPRTPLSPAPSLSLMLQCRTHSPSPYPRKTSFPRGKNTHLCQPLLHAMCADDVQAVQALIDDDPLLLDLPLRHSQEPPILAAVANSCSMKMVSLLLKSGADP